MSEIQHRKKDKNQHIQVFVRVRPANKDEICGKSSTVVEVPSPREVLVRERLHDNKLSKKFTFDRVFDSKSKQLDIYNIVVSPLLHEVLAGYNCTVFAYGQTGTGKTFTMEGVCNDPSVHWQSDTPAGIIPRFLNHLFDSLRTLECQDNTVKVSFLELYNEELFDLLSSSDDASKIRIYEDTNKKGAVIIHGLEEVIVHNKNEVYKILQKGSEKRQTAATLMNAHSSRSHTVFSITVHIKETTVDGEELVKTGKLNLVDLAGSENVGRSGAVDRRAREAGNINQSLLTLGRVITALVERGPHIPYRESKLTRLLQESLGGRTKTSIIATVSPAAMNFEETISTLDYAYRAKNITNKPEVNQKLSKIALFKEYTDQIERLRRDLQASREQNGVYLAQEDYNELQTTVEFRGKQVEENISHIKALEEMILNKEKNLEELKKNLEQSQYQIKLTEQEKNEQKHLVEKHLITETKLSKQANELLNMMEVATHDTTKLHEKIDRKNKVEEENEYLGNQFRKNIAVQFDNINHQLSDHTQASIQFSLSTRDEIQELTDTNSRGIQTAINIISGQLVKNEQCIANEAKIEIHSNKKNYEDSLVEIVNKCLKMSSDQSESQTKMYSTLAVEIDKLVKNEISENLKKINEDHQKKMNQLDELSDRMKNVVSDVYNKFNEMKSILNEKINMYTDRINEAISAQTNLSKREDNFLKMFNNLHREYMTIHDEKKMVYDTLTTVADEGLEFCKNVEVQMENSCSNQTQIKNIIDHDFSNTIVLIKDQLLADVQANLRITESSIQQMQSINEKLQKDISENEERLKMFNDDISSHICGMRSKMNNDMEHIVNYIENIDKIVSGFSVSHENLLDDHKKKLETSSQNICQRLENQCVQLTEWNNQITSDVRTTQHQFDKFFVEDMRRDVPTGSTPGKRQFDYSNIQPLAATSPHDRIIQRFRQMEHEANVLQLGNDDSLSSPNDQFKSPSTPPTNTELYFTVTRSSTESNDDSHHNERELVRAESISDLSYITRDLSKEMIRSASDVTCKAENKENGIDSFVKPVEFKNSRISKLKNPTRRILSSQNS